MDRQVGNWLWLAVVPQEPQEGAVRRLFSRRRLGAAEGVEGAVAVELERVLFGPQRARAGDVVAPQRSSCESGRRLGRLLLDGTVLGVGRRRARAPPRGALGARRARRWRRRETRVSRPIVAAGAPPLAGLDRDASGRGPDDRRARASPGAVRDRTAPVFGNGRAWEGIAWGQRRRMRENPRERARGAVGPVLVSFSRRAGCRRAGK